MIEFFIYLFILCSYTAMFIFLCFGIAYLFSEFKFSLTNKKQQNVKNHSQTNCEKSKRNSKEK